MSKEIYMNAKGEFLSVHEVTSHSPHKTYTFQFGPLNEATLFSNQRNERIDSYRWKGDTPYTQITATLQAEVEVTRVVTVIGPKLSSFVSEVTVKD